jgi:hypothetical protein
VIITANQPFLHGHDRYEEGEDYDVDDALGTYFVMSGWATSDEVPGVADSPPEVDLDVHDGTSDQEVDTRG